MLDHTRPQSQFTSALTRHCLISGAAVGLPACVHVHACMHVQVDDTEYTAEHIVIAVGGEPTMPPIPGAELCLDSNGFFALEAQPDRSAFVF